MVEVTAYHDTRTFPHMVSLPFPCYSDEAVMACRAWLNENVGNFGVRFTDNAWGGPGEYAPSVPFTVWFDCETEAALFRLAHG